ncbi:MAG: hypothetical protein ACKER6_00260 [Candidatus Hodgkinia cicadicola]
MRQHLYRNIKLLRKLTGLGISVCKTLLNANEGRVDIVLNNLPKQVVPSQVIDGKFYVGCVKSKLTIYIFKIYANVNIYNNRYLRTLWMALNKATQTLKPERISLIEQLVCEGVMIYACLTLDKYNGVHNLYCHTQLCTFVHESACLVALSSYACERKILCGLAKVLSRHFMCYALCNSHSSLRLIDALNSAYIYNNSISASIILAEFERRNVCKINIQRVFPLVDNKSLPTTF